MAHGVILQSERDVSTAKIYQAVLLGITVWDWLMSLRSEYRFIWKGKATVPKALYIVARYVCLILTVLVFAIQFLDIPLESCHAFVRANCLSLTIVQVTSISVLTQRVWAVFTHPRWRYPLIALLLLLDLATLLMGILHAAMAVDASAAPMNPETWTGFCQIQVLNGWMGMTAAFFALPIAAHTLATAAVVYAVNPLPNTNAVKRLLLVDGVLYMLAVNSIGIIQLIFFFQTSSESLKMLNSAALLSLTAVFCCRFMLHLREQAEEIHRNPFGRQPEASELTDLTSSSSGEKSGLSKLGFLRRQSRQPTISGGHRHSRSKDRGTHARKASAAAGCAGTVTVHSEPDTLVSASSPDFVTLKQQDCGDEKRLHPVHFVTVEQKVEQQVTGMSELEKEYSAYVLHGIPRASEDNKECRVDRDLDDEDEKE